MYLKGILSWGRLCSCHVCSFDTRQLCAFKKLNPVMWWYVVLAFLNKSVGYNLVANISGCHITVPMNDFQRPQSVFLCRIWIGLLLQYLKVKNCFVCPFHCHAMQQTYNATKFCCDIPAFHCSCLFGYKCKEGNSHLFSQWKDCRPTFKLWVNMPKE